MKKLNKDITIVIVNDFDYVQGGASKVAIDTAKILHENGYKVIFFSGVHDEAKYVDLGYKNISLKLKENLKDKNIIRGAFRNLYSFKAKHEFRNLLNELDPQKTIIHIHGWTKCLSSSIFDVAFNKRFKVVLTLHDYFTSCPNGGFFNYQKNKICKLEPLSFKCLCSNCDSRNYLFKIFRYIREGIQNKIVKLPKRIENIIYISDLQWSVLKKNFKNNIHVQKILNPIELNSNNCVENFKNNKYFLYVGRLAPEKGVEDFCKACTELDVYGVVVGDGEQLEYLKEKYKSLNFVGWKTSKEVKNYMLNAKALVFPSLWYEGAPLTVEESLALKLPCIVSNSNSAIEKIVDGKNGFIYSTGDLEELKDKMNSINKLNYVPSHISHSREEYFKELLVYYLNVLE